MATPLMLNCVGNVWAESITVASGETKTIDSNTNYVVNKDASLKIGGILNVNGTLEVESGGYFEAYEGSKTNVTGTLIFSNGSNINKEAIVNDPNRRSSEAALNILDGGTVKMYWTPYFGVHGTPGTDAYDPGQAANPDWLEGQTQFFPDLKITLKGNEEGGKISTLIIDNKGSRTEGEAVQLVVSNSGTTSTLTEDKYKGSITVGEYSYLEIPNLTLLPSFKEGEDYTLNLKNSLIASERLTISDQGSSKYGMTVNSGTILITGKKDAGSSLTAPEVAVATFAGGSTLQLGNKDQDDHAAERFGGTIEGQIIIGDAVSNDFGVLDVSIGQWTIGTTQDTDGGHGTITVEKNGILRIGITNEASLIFSEGAGGNVGQDWGKLVNNGNVIIGENGTLQVANLTVENKLLLGNISLLDADSYGSYNIANGGNLTVTELLKITGGDYTATFGDATTITVESLQMDSGATYTHQGGTLKLVGKENNADSENIVFSAPTSLTSDIEGYPLLKVNGGEVSIGGEKTNTGILVVQGRIEVDGGSLNIYDSVQINGELFQSGGIINIDPQGTLISKGTLKTETLLINNGTICIGYEDFNGKLIGNVENNKELIFWNDTTYDGSISGTGNLTQKGSGTLILTGTVIQDMIKVESGTLDASRAALTTHSGLSLYGGATFKPSGSYDLNNKTLTVNAANGQSATYQGDLKATNATLNFISSVNPTEPLLVVTGNADISNSKYNVGLTDASGFTEGATLTLMKVEGQLNANNLTRGDGIVKIGSTVVHDITDNISINPITGELSAVMEQGKAIEQSKTLSEGWMGGLSLSLQGADIVAGKGIDAARQAVQGQGGYASFAALSAGSVQYNTGSHVDMKSFTLLTGLAIGADIDCGNLTLGTFFEFGNGSYDTYNSFSNAASTHGDGNNHYAGGGILGRMDFLPTGPGFFYIEASARMGGLHNKYGSHDLRDALGRTASYNSYSRYYSAHLGSGYVWNLNDNVNLDLYAKYFWTRLESDNLTLSTGEALHFKHTDSKRLRLGGRISYVHDETFRPYVGLAWEHEFDGKIKATTDRHDIPEPSLQGDTGIGEIGLSFTPSDKVPLSIDLSLQGYVGKREDVTGSLQVKWSF